MKTTAPKNLSSGVKKVLSILKGLSAKKKTEGKL